MTETESNYFILTQEMLIGSSDKNKPAENSFEEHLSDEILNVDELLENDSDETWLATTNNSKENTKISKKDKFILERRHSMEEIDIDGRIF